MADLGLIDLPDPIVRDWKSIQRNFDKLAQLGKTENVTLFPFSANWSAFNTTLYYKDRNRVYLKGYVGKTSGAAPAVGDVIGTLPAGYRPAGNLHFAVPSGGSANVFGVIRITSAGQVQWLAGSAAVNDLIGLDGIDFRVDV